MKHNFNNIPNNLLDALVNSMEHNFYNNFMQNCLWLISTIYIHVYILQC